MDQGLIQVQHQSLATSVLWLLARDHCVLCRGWLFTEPSCSLQFDEDLFGEEELLLKELNRGLSGDLSLSLFLSLGFLGLGVG